MLLCNLCVALVRGFKRTDKKKNNQDVHPLVFVQQALLPALLPDPCLRLVDVGARCAIACKCELHSDRSSSRSQIPSNGNSVLQQGWSQKGGGKERVGK